MSNKTIFQFISEPGDVNYGGNVHGGSVMKWIDQAGYACASSWSSSYCVTVYVGGIRFFFTNQNWSHCKSRSRSYLHRQKQYAHCHQCIF